MGAQKIKVWDPANLIKGDWPHKLVTDREFACLNSQLPNPARKQIVTLPNSIFQKKYLNCDSDESSVIYIYWIKNILT